jgi:hypothetical protein
MAIGQKTGGRTKGTPNKATADVKAALCRAFDGLGGVPALIDWGRTNPTEFYRLWARLLPQDMKAQLSANVHVDLHAQIQAARLRVIKGYPDGAKRLDLKPADVRALVVSDQHTNSSSQ